MNRKNIRLILSLVVLLILSAVVYLQYSGQKNTTIDQELSDFAISDTSSIQEIIISDQDKNKIVLERDPNFNWKLNDKYKARQESVDLILLTAKRIAVKSPVAISARENMVKNLSVKFKKVEFFSGDGLLKTWFVGDPAKDNLGSIMLLETPDLGRSDVPFIMEIPGFYGELTSRFFVEEYHWRFSGIFNYDPTAIKRIRLVDNTEPEMGFELDIEGKNTFILKDFKGQVVKEFDTIPARAYAVNFQKIHYETLNRGILSKEQEDSLKKAVPYVVISVTDKNDQTRSVPVYRKKATSDQLDLEGNPYPWDTERSYVVLESGEVAIVQAGVFDQIIWPIKAFKDRSLVGL